MGIGSSKQSAGGTLKGAYAPPLPGMAIPKIPREDKKYAITCPQDKKGGDTMTVMLKGNKKTLTIPKLHVTNNVSHVTRPGDKFFWTDYAWKKVIASTLPALPGATTIEAKPMIWASSSKTGKTLNNFDTLSTMGTKVGPLLQECQEELLKQALSHGCNAVLSININVTTDSTDIGSGSNGSFGKSKLMIATMSGTPCIVIPNTTLPPVTVNIDSSMLIAAEYNYDVYPEADVTPTVTATARRV